MFAQTAAQPAGLAKRAFELYIKPFAQEGSLYDCRRFVATCYHQVGVPMRTLMSLGGWTTETSLRKAYIEGQFLISDSMRDHFKWLLDESPLLTSMDELSNPRPPKKRLLSDF